MPNPDTRNYAIFYSTEDEEFVAVCDKFPSLSWLAPTASEALDGLLELLGDFDSSGAA